MNKMKYRLFRWILFLNFSFFGLVSMSSYAAEMNFIVHNGAATCSSCNIISADGIFTNKTGEDFKKLLKNKTDLLNKKTIVILNSPGGSVQGGLELGQIIHSSGLDTHIGKVGESKDGTVVIDAGVCSSSCALAFLGGVARSASFDSRYGLHQVSTTSTEFVPLNKAVEGTQSLIAEISRYLKSVNASQEIITLSTQTKSSAINWLSDEELSRLRIYNSNTLYEQQPWMRSRSPGGNLWTVKSILENGANNLFLMQCNVIPRSGKAKVIVSTSLTLPEHKHPFFNGFSPVIVSVVVSGKILSTYEQTVYFTGSNMGSIRVELPSRILGAVADNEKSILLRVDYGSLFPENVAQINYIIPAEGLKSALHSLSQTCPCNPPEK